MTEDSGLKIGGSTHDDIDTLIQVSWDFGREIRFTSSRYTFSEDAGNVSGGSVCGKHESTPEELGIAVDRHILRFEPSQEFWHCTEYINCDPGDEILEFELLVRRQ